MPTQSFSSAPVYLKSAVNILQKRLQALQGVQTEVSSQGERSHRFIVSTHDILQKQANILSYGTQQQNTTLAKLEEILALASSTWNNTVQARAQDLTFINSAERIQAHMLQKVEEILVSHEERLHACILQKFEAALASQTGTHILQKVEDILKQLQHVPSASTIVQEIPHTTTGPSLDMTTITTILEKMEVLDQKIDALGASGCADTNPERNDVPPSPSKPARNHRYNLRSLHAER